MPTRKQQVKWEIRVDKIDKRNLDSRLKSTELTGHGSPKDMKDASQVLLPSVSQSRWDSTLKKSVRKSSLNGRGNSAFVPVIGNTGKPLMPCLPVRARELMAKDKAVGKWKTGIFYIQLLDRIDGVTQIVAVGIDPGSKREAFTVKSAKHTYLNVLSDAVTWVKDVVETRQNMRRTRRYRKTPCRANRENRARGSIPPSTKARWQAKLRIVDILWRLYPVTCCVVEDIQATTKEGKKKWNASFSPLEVGKQWFYGELKTRCELVKTKSKMEECFPAHNLDSWVLANFITGGHIKPDNTSIFRLIPLRLHRRQLHRLKPDKGGIRRSYGGTISDGLKRGSLVRHKKWGLCYVGGYMNGVGISLHSLEDGQRVCRNAKKKDLILLRYGGWRFKMAA